MSRIQKGETCPERNRRVFVALSGGVDSSVAALLLKQQGYAVTGAFMRCVNLDGCAERDAEDARRVAECLGIPFYVFDFEKQYRQEVVDYLIEGYRSGETPNPDVMCNKQIKFGAFLERARALGADYIATGHYVRLVHKRIGNEKKTVPMLAAAYDTSKDQSYFLWTLTADVLNQCLFPLGEYQKKEVRALARKAELPTAEKKDSQGICFLGKVSLADFLKTSIPPRSGEIITTDGRVVGEHDGAWYYTAGQRHGLNLKEKQSALHAHGARETRPHYVVSKNVDENTVVVAEGDDQALFTHSITLRDGMVRGMKEKQMVYVRVRYREPLSRATLSCSGGKYTLVFLKPHRAVAPGQSAVFYNAQSILLGGGIITDTI
jgi:tRNA-specific 2-thiouridylase